MVVIPGLLRPLLFLQYRDKEESLPYQVWSFPNLEYLTLNIYLYNIDGSDNDDENHVLTTLQFLPKLHTVIIEFKSVTIPNVLSVHLPWAQLTSGDGRCPGIPLAHPPDTMPGYFTFTGRVRDETLSTVDITLENLKSLAVGFRHLSDPLLFNGIHFPALRDFEFSPTMMPSRTCHAGSEHMFLQLAPVIRLIDPGPRDIPP